jgi:hypothetical protein
MSRAGVKVKAASGWFAAGVEMQRAATVLADNAFKVYVWLCLHAERDRGCLRVNPEDMAADLRKTQDEIRACLLELDRTGVCHCDLTNLVRISDSFWPYTRTEQARRDGHEAELYVSEVKRLFLAHACVSTGYTPADDRIAAEWYQTGVSLEAVERAIQLGCLRKYATLINHGSGTPITTLGYFRSLVEEVTDSNASADYWQYVGMRLADLERRWRRHCQQRRAETK